MRVLPVVQLAIIRPWPLPELIGRLARQPATVLQEETLSTVCHVVLVSWKSGTAATAEELVRPAARAFIDTIPGVLAVTEGHSTSPEGLENGYDYGLVVTFDSASARDVYLDHPAHRPVAEAIGAAAEKIVVFDL
jgi:hypothetical protein